MPCPEEKPRAHQPRRPGRPAGARSPDCPAPPPRCGFSGPAISRAHAVDAHRRDRRALWLGFALRRARARRVPAANSLQPARRAARRRLFRPRPRAAGPTTRSAKSCARSTRSAAPCANSGSARMEATMLLRTVMREIDVAIFAFDEHAAPAPGQPRRRAPAGRARRSACSDRPPKNWSSNRASTARR